MRSQPKLHKFISPEEAAISLRASPANRLLFRATLQLSDDFSMHFFKWDTSPSSFSVQTEHNCCEKDSKTAAGEKRGPCSLLCLKPQLLTLCVSVWICFWALTEEPTERKRAKCEARTKSLDGFEQPPVNVGKEAASIFSSSLRAGTETVRGAKTQV